GEGDARDIVPPSPALLEGVPDCLLREAGTVFHSVVTLLLRREDDTPIRVDQGDGGVMAPVTEEAHVELRHDGILAWARRKMETAVRGRPPFGSGALLAECLLLFFFFAAEQSAECSAF